MADIKDVEAAHSDSVVFHRAPDTHRLYTEMTEAKNTRNMERLAYRVGTELMSVFASAKCDNPSILAQTLELVDSESGVSGKISYSVSAIYNGDTRVVNVPVSVKSGKHELPESMILQALLESSKGLQKSASEILRKEVDEFISNRVSPLAVEASLDKVAVSTSHPGSVLAPVMDVDKTWLPTDIAVGDLLFLGGAKYRVTSGSRGKLSADSDGSFWTLSLVHETADPKEPVKTIL